MPSLNPFPLNIYPLHPHPLTTTPNLYPLTGRKLDSSNTESDSSQGGVPRKKNMKRKGAKLDKENEPSQVVPTTTSTVDASTPADSSPKVNMFCLIF
jgi:hypothetical protein